MAIPRYPFQVSSIRLEVEAGESKLLLFETFWLPFFLSDTIYKGAHAPKKDD